MSKVYPYSKQNIDRSDINAVFSVLKSNYLTQGDKVPKFEKYLSKYTGAKYVSAVNSATSGLFLACKALGLKKNDIAWTVTNSFVASSNCILHCNAKIDFIDINNEDFNIDIDLVEKKLKKTPKNKLPKIIIPVHFAGKPYDQKRLYNLSLKYKFKIIEDASHAIGALNDKQKVGNCKWSDVVVFSFHPVKIISTGEGGATLTNNKKIDEKIKNLRTHGITRDLKKLNIKENGYWYYEQINLGFNFRMSDIHAALGISQLKRIEKFIRYRNKISKFYREKLKDLPISFQKMSIKLRSSYHLFVIKLLNKRNIQNYKKIFNFLRKNNILVNLHYLPIHTHPYYKKFGFREGDFLNAEKYSKSALSIPIYYGLKTNEQLLIIKKIKKALIKYS